MRLFTFGPPGRIVDVEPVFLVGAVGERLVDSRHARPRATQLVPNVHLVERLRRRARRHCKGDRPSDSGRKKNVEPRRSYRLHASVPNIRRRI